MDKEKPNPIFGLIILIMISISFYYYGYYSGIEDVQETLIKQGFGYRDNLTKEFKINGSF